MIIAAPKLARVQRFARAALVIGLVVLGIWTVHTFLPALIWAVILAIGRELNTKLRIGSERLFGRRGERIGLHIVASVHGTLSGLVLVGLCEGFVLGIAYRFAGVPHPVLLGVLTAVAAMIPFGVPLVFLIAAALLVGQGAVTAAIVVAVFGFFVLAIADHVIRPVLIGGATQLPFLWVLFGILGGVETWGLLGLFFAPAIMASLMLLWRELTSSSETVEVRDTIAV
jgi:predicted PurR-regulated permease PerM